MGRRIGWIRSGCQRRPDLRLGRRCPTDSPALRTRAPHRTVNHMVQYTTTLDSTFAAVADPTRRGILAYLGRRDASITELADAFAMTLTGMKKHVAVLEQTRLVATKKEGRVRTCRIGPRKLEREAEWIARFQQMIDDRFDRLEALLGRTPDE